MIHVKNLTKNYGDRTAIQNLNFFVNKGEVVGFLGPNGAGKSTTMKIITGYMAPTEGQVQVGDFDVFENPIQVKEKIGYLPEIPPVYTDMIIEEYLEYVAKLRGVDHHAIKQKVDVALEKTDLGDVRKRLINNLSKGFRQRVGVAQALVSDPEILILDEPTAGLDPKQVAEMRKMINALKGYHTIILSTHILPEVQASCEKVIIINEGQIVAEDTLVELSQKMSGGHKIVARVRRPSNNLVQSLIEIPGVNSARLDGIIFHIDSDPREETVESVANHLVNQGAGLLEFTTESMDLEDIFIRLTSNKKGRN